MSEPTPEERAASLLRGHADNFKVKQFALLLTRDIAAAIRGAVAAERERCAKVVENGQETTKYTKDGDTVHYLSPRSHGNISGLAYAAGIRGT